MAFSCRRRNPCDLCDVYFFVRKFFVNAFNPKCKLSLREVGLPMDIRKYDQRRINFVINGVAELISPKVNPIFKTKTKLTPGSLHH